MVSNVIQIIITLLKQSIVFRIVFSIFLTSIVYFFYQLITFFFAYIELRLAEKKLMDNGFSKKDIDDLYKKHFK